jgi:asparaginyl-tRNA synthetase
MGTSALEHASQKFAFSVWGIDPQSEHERYLTEQQAKKPVIVITTPRTSRRSTCG